MTDYDAAFGAALDPQSPQASDTGSRYDDAFSAIGEAADSAAHNSLYRAQGANPDHAAKVQSLARRTGLHPDTVETTFPDVERQVRLADQQRVLASSPALKSWLADAANAKVAHDDFDRLSLVERTVSTAKTGWHEAVAGNERGRLAYRGIGGQLAPADDSRIKELDGELSAKFGGDGNPFFHTVRTVSGLLGGLWDMAERAAPTAAAGTAVGGAWGVAGGPLAPATIPAGMALGASAGFGAGMFADAFQVSAGNLYHGLGTARDVEGRPVDDRVREGASLFGGLVVGALQTWGIRVGAKPYAEAGQRLVEDAVREAVARPGTALAMASFGREVAKGSGEGAILGAATEAANVVAEQVARLASDGDFRTVLDDPAQRSQALDRILAGASDMAVGMGVLRMPPAGVNLGADLLRARRATSDHAFLTDLASGATESRTRERAPDAFRQFIAGQMDGSPVERLFIPGEKMRELYQSFGIHDPFALTEDPLFGRAVPDMPRQLAEALRTGGDVVIPTADYAAHLAGTRVDEALRPDIRVRPDGWTMREASEFNGKVGDILQARAAEMAVRHQTEAAAAEPATRVFDDVFSKLRAAGYTIDAAHQQSALWAARYATRAERMGSGDAWSWYGETPVEIRRALPDSLKDRSVDSLDILLEALRKGDGASQREMFGPSLGEFVAHRGGVADPGGELTALGADAWHQGKPGMPRLLRADLGPTGEFHPDSVALAAHEAGYFPELQGVRPTPDHLFEAIREELANRPRHSEKAGNDAKAQWRSALGDLDRVLGELGIDPRTERDNAAIKEALARYASVGEGDASALRQPVNVGINLERRLPFIPVAPVAERGKVGKLGTESAKAIDTAPITNADTGWSFEVSRGKLDAIAGKFEKSVSHLDHLAALRAVRAITEQAVLVDSHPDAAGRAGIVQAHRFFAPIQVDGRRYAVKTTVLEYADGRRELDEGTILRLHEQRLEKRLPTAPGADGVGAGASSAEVPPREGAASEGRPDSTAVPRHTEADISLRDLLAGIKDTDGQAYAQGSDGRARGSIAFGDGRTVITLFRDADLSTLLHESTHLWLDELVRDATRVDAPEGLRADLAAVMQWMRVGDPGMISAMHHEKWARAGESYFMEGKAPSAGLDGAFSRFRAWLVSIYRALHGTGNAINDDIRGVFDRLIATDEQIAAKAEQQRLGRLFASAEQAGMTEAEFRAYVAAADTAREEARTTVERKAMAEIRRVQTEWWKAEVKGELSRRPDLAALTYLRTGRMPDGSEPAARLRLSRDALVQLLGSEAGLSLLPKGVPPIVVKKGGVHPDFVAELFGYRSGEEMVKALMSIEAQQRDLRKAGDRRSVLSYLIDRETRSRMEERHGDMLKDGSIEDVALAAVHNDRQGEVLATELRTLARRSGKDGATTPAALARQWAARLIAEKTVRDAIAVDRYVRAEAAAGRAAEKALLAGDHAEASRQKERQLLNHALVMEAKRAADDVDGAVAMLAKLAAKPTLKGMAQDHLDQIHGLLERFDFRYAPRRAVEQRKALAEWVAEQHDLGNEVAVPARLLDESGRQHYTDMTVENMRGLADAVRNIAHLGRLKQRLLDGKEQREFDAVVEEVVRQAADLPQRDLPRERNPDGPWHGFTTMLQGFDASLLKMEQVFDWLDGHQEDGVFNRVIFRRAAERQGVENDLRRAVAGELKTLNARLGPALRAGFDRYLPDLHELPDSRTGEPTRMRKSELLALALNAGNESNFDKLARGERWSPDAVWTALQRHLTRADWTYVQGVWDLLDHTLWPQVEAMEKRMSGVAPEKVAAREFTVRPADGGEPMTLRGGYYPVVYDPLRAFDVEQRRQFSADRLFENNYQRATTPKGHTIERVDGYARPLHLSLDVLPHHLEAVVHDLAWREFIMDADRFLGDRRIREAVEHTLGREVYKQFRPWLQGIANDRAYDPRGLAWWDRSAHWARTNTTMVGLGYRLTTMLVHGSTAASNSIGEVGTKWMGVGVREFFGGPDKMARARDFVFERSAEMRHRMNETDRDVRDGLRELRGQTGPVAQARRFAYYGISMLDMASAMPTWIGAYRKALSEGKVEADAIFSADKAVRNAHGGGGIKDLAAIQRGNEFQKLATMFYSFWNHFYNRQRDLGRRMGLAWDKATDGRFAEAGHDFAMVLARSWFYFVLPQIFHGLFKTGGPDEDHGWLPWAAEEIALGLVSGIPVARDVANSTFTGRDYQATPVASMVESLLNTGHDAAAAVGIGEHEPSERWLRHAIETTGYVFGLPTGQLGTGVQFTWDVMRGEQRADDLADWLRGIAIGGPRKAH